MTEKFDEIIEFVLANTNGQYAKLPAEDFIDALQKHKEYGTLMTLRDNKGLAAIARWNWVSGNEVKVLDCVVRKDVRRVKMLKYLIHIGKKHNKNVKYISYDRHFKYPYRKPKRIKIGG